MDYSFLEGLTLVDTGRQRQPKEVNPTGLAVRVFANGNVYPSKELIERFNLEYTTKEEQGTRNGFDVVDSTDWAPTAHLPRMILFGVTPKTEAKVDLFSSCRYTDDNQPKSSVSSQGSDCQTLLNLIRSMGYLTEDQKYCDLQIVITHPITVQDGIANIPKVVERGERKGEKTYERRENITFYPVNTPENLAPKTEPTTSTTQQATVTN